MQQLGNKSFKVTTDINLIRELLKDEYDKLVYDGSPELEDFIPKGIWFILYQDSYTSGLINLEKINNIMWNTHVIIYEDYRGKDSYIWGNLVIDFMEKQFGDVKLIGFTPYEAAKKFAEKIGFKQTAVLTKSIKKNGNLLDQYLMER